MNGLKDFEDELRATLFEVEATQGEVTETSIAL